MPRSRKRHHSRSRSKTRSRSPSRERSFEKQKKPGSHEKDGKRRRLDEIIDSPQQKRSLSSDHDGQPPNNSHEESPDKPNPMELDNKNSDADDCAIVETNEAEAEENDVSLEVVEKPPVKNEVGINDADGVQIQCVYDKKDKVITPKKPVTPKQLQKKLESEKKKQQKQKEREEREKQRQEEKAKLLAEKEKIKDQKEAERRKLIEEKQKQLELKQKEKELKEEQRKREKEEKEQKRKEREEMEAQKRKEKEQERLKKLQEIEEKNKEKQKEEEKKQKTAALFVNFFKKTDAEEKDKKSKKTTTSNFMPFEIKSDMRLPPPRRKPLSPSHLQELDSSIQNQNATSSYLKDLKCSKFQPGNSPKTWHYEDPEDEVTIIEDDKNLGETIDENFLIRLKTKAKFLSFHDNRRPAYFGTWRKTSKFITPRKPFGEDTDNFNYEEDSDDDWEEEEQGESLEISGDEDEKDAENDVDDYEVDNEFFVPHGHLSDDEVDDEENARLSPESLKQKLKLLKDEFEQDIKSKTAKLKSRCIGGVWLNAQGDNVEEAIYRYLQPFAMIVRGPVEIKKRSDIFWSPSAKSEKKKMTVELPIEQVPYFLKIIHGNVNKKKTIAEEFLTFMTNNGFNVDTSMTSLVRFIKQCATYKRCNEEGPLKNKFGWLVNDDVIKKYDVKVDLSKRN